MRNGINESQVYPYNDKRINCRKKSFSRWKNLKGQLRIDQNVINLILALNIGPVSVVQYASKEFKFYTDGIYKGEGCEFGWVPNHSAMVYGYNLEAEEPYFFFKNGWGIGRASCRERV